MDTPQASMRNLARPSSAVEAASASVPVATHVLEAVRDCEALQIFLTRFDGTGESRMETSTFKVD